MNKNDVIARYITEKYPEILETFDFASFEIMVACEEMVESTIKIIKESTFIETFKKGIDKVLNSKGAKKLQEDLHSYNWRESMMQDFLKESER